MGTIGRRIDDGLAIDKGMLHHVVEVGVLAVRDNVEIKAVQAYFKKAITFINIGNPRSGDGSDEGGVDAEATHQMDGVAAWVVVPDDEGGTSAQVSRAQCGPVIESVIH